MLHARVQNGNMTNIYSRLMVVFSGISPWSPSKVCRRVFKRPIMDRFKSKVSSKSEIHLRFVANRAVIASNFTAANKHFSANAVKLSLHVTIRDENISQAAS